MKKALSLAMAGVMAISTSVVASAAETDSELASMLSMVKQRINVSEDISEFSYSVENGGPLAIYYFNWNTPRGADEYKSVNVTAYGSVITQYSKYDSNTSYSKTPSLAKLTSDQLYSYAVKAVKQLNPTVGTSIRVDRESISMNVYSSRVSFNVYRVKNGVPVESDRGYISLDKNTGELRSFSISWHPKASFKSKKGVLSEDEAWEKYGDLITLAPYYEIQYDWENERYTSQLVYRQTDYGEINAYTGDRSDFVSDGYFGGETEEACEDEDAVENPATGGADKGFTEEELRELNKELPYGSEEAAIKLIKSNKYLSFDDGMVLSWDNLYKNTFGGEEEYVYTAYFSNEEKYYYDETVEEPLDEEWNSEQYFYSSVSITLNAETGEIKSYYYYNSQDETDADSYDMEKADKLAAKIAKSLAPSHVKDYTDYSSNVWSYTRTSGKNASPKTYYNGSYHTFGRMANGISVSGNEIMIGLNAEMKLTNYEISYNNVEFASPEGMLTADEALNAFRKTHDLELYYKARTGKKKTATVLVYGCDTNVYCDAFTGEQVFNWNYDRTNDLSGIVSPDVLRKAKVLDDNGIIISESKFAENDAVSAHDFAQAISIFMKNGVYSIEKLPSGEITEWSADKLLTRGDAMTIFAQGMCSKDITSLKGIFKNPFTDVSDDDEYLGCYAVAYALGAAKGDTLRAADAYTYGDFINLIYDLAS